MDRQRSAQSVLGLLALSIRKRHWINRDGSHNSAWTVNFTSPDGKRRLRTFPRLRDAQAFRDSLPPRPPRRNKVIEMSWQDNRSEPEKLFTEVLRMGGRIERKLDLIIRKLEENHD
jgi:hypothetical protein